MNIIGHQKQWQYLKRSAESDRLAHAYLFYGPAKIGKKTLALEFAKLLGAPTDLALVEPEASADEGEKAVIHILQIRELKSKLFLSAIDSGYKVAIIDEAPAMTADAQSALLKLLEEPKGKTILILLAQNLNQLLPTIVSRCQPLRFDLLPSQEIEKYLCLILLKHLKKL